MMAPRGEASGFSRDEVSTANGSPRRDGAVTRASTAPGLGLTPRMETLGAPIAVVE